MVSSGFIRPTAGGPPEPTTPQLLKAGSVKDLKEAAKVDQSKMLIGRIVERVCKCVETDEGTQIVIVKVCSH